MKKWFLLILLFIFALLITTDVVNAQTPGERTTPFTKINDTPIGKKCSSNNDCRWQSVINGQATGVLEFDCEDSSDDIEDDNFCVCDDANQCAITYGSYASLWECKDGVVATRDLHYCYYTGPVSNPAFAMVPPLDVKQIVESVTEKQESSSILGGTTTPKFTKPTLYVLGAVCNLSDVDFVPGQESNIPWISECIAGIYKKMLILGVIFAILFIVIGGVQFIISAGNPGNINKAKETMTKSVLGLLLLICSYIILYTVNPEITSLKLAQIDVIDVIELQDIPEYEEGPDFPSGKELPDSSDLPSTVKPVVGPATYKNNNYVYGIVKDETCLNGYFFPSGIKMGDKISSSTTRISILGLDKFWDRSTPQLQVHDDQETIDRVNKAKASGKGYVVTVHKQAVSAWQAFTNDLINSTDPEVKGYMQYIWDRAAGKAPSLSGTWKPNDIAQSNLGCGIGVQRKTCSGTKAPLKTVYADPHLTGQAIDIMTLSNNDNKTSQSPSSKGDDATSVCNRYKDTLEKMKNGTYGDYFKSDPYVLYERMDQIIAGCLAGKNAAWSIPDGMIDLAVKHKFYWAGWAWADPFRADGMHFEYYGPCFGLKNETPRP